MPKIYHVRSLWLSFDWAFAFAFALANCTVQVVKMHTFSFYITPKIPKRGYRDEAALTWDFEKKKTQIALAWCSSKTLWYATCDENMPKIGGLVFFFEISYQSCPPKSTPKNQFCWSITNFGKPLAPLDSLPQNCPKTHVPIVCKCLPPSPSPNSCTVFLLYFPLSAYLHISQNDEILLAILNKR